VVRFAGVSLAEAIRLATRNPARLFGVDGGTGKNGSSGGYGRLEAGQSADILLFRWDETEARMSVAATVAAGQIVYTS
jgi:imidazolonepropionase-like amidohydrolase